MFNRALKRLIVLTHHQIMLRSLSFNLSILPLQPQPPILLRLVNQFQKAKVNLINWQDQSIARHMRQRRSFVIIRIK